MRMLHGAPGLIATGFCLTVMTIWEFLQNFDLVPPGNGGFGAAFFWFVGLGVGALYNKLTIGHGGLRVNNRLKLLRAERNWSQNDLADRLEVSRQSVNAIETGRYDPSLPLAFRIAELFGLADRGGVHQPEPAQLESDLS